MTALLDAIRAERRALIEPLLAPVAEQLRTLDELERLAASLNGGGSAVPVVEAPPPPAAAPKRPAREQRALPARTKPTGQGRDGLGAKATAVLDVLRAPAADWMSAGQIAAAVGLTTTALKHHIARLIERGLIEARGQTLSRRYRAVPQDAAKRKVTTFGAGRPPGKSKPAAAGSLQGRVLEAVGYKPGSVDEVAKRLGVPAGGVAEACDTLLSEGEIVAQPDGRYRGT